MADEILGWFFRNLNAFATVGSAIGLYAFLRRGARKDVADVKKEVEDMKREITSLKTESSSMKFMIETMFRALIGSKTGT